MFFVEMKALGRDTVIRVLITGCADRFLGRRLTQALVGRPDSDLTLVDPVSSRPRRISMR
jgi:nucleoside-diphosphate-sugar epimerase